MGGNIGAILAGLAGGAGALGQAMDEDQKKALARAAFQRLLDKDKQESEDRQASIAERAQAAKDREQARADALRENAMKNLTSSYDTAGIHVLDPNVMQTITGSRLTPDVPSAPFDYGVGAIANAATQGGQDIAGGVQSAAIKALAQSTAKQGANVPLSVGSRQIGFARDPNAVKSAEQEQAHKYRMEEARAGRVDNTLTPVVDPSDPTGNRVIYMPRGQAAGLLVPQKGAGAAGKTPSALTMMALTRVRQFAKDLDQADPSMSEFENPTSPHNISQVGIPMKMAGTAAGAQPSIETKGGLTEQLGNLAASGIQGVGQTNLNSDELGKKYRVYTTNAKRLGLGLAEMLPRPNNALVGMEQSLSAADIGPTNEGQTKLVQDRRRAAGQGAKAILSMNPQFVEAMQQQDPTWISRVIKTTIETGQVPQMPPEAFAGGDTTPGGGQKVMSQAAYQRAIAAGHSPEEIKAAGWTVKP